MATKKPVTGSGWYENNDGTIGKYLWIAGQLTCSATVADWEAAKRYDDEGQKLPPANYERDNA